MCLDKCSVDLASLKQFTETDFKALFVNNMSKLLQVCQPLYEQINKEIHKQLDSGEEVKAELEKQLTLKLTEQFKAE